LNSDYAIATLTGGAKKPDALLANRRLNERHAASVNFVVFTALMGVGRHFDDPDMGGLNPLRRAVCRTWAASVAP